MDFRTFIGIVAFRWKIVLATILACLLGAITYTALQPKTYAASATILVSFGGAITINDAYEATYAAQNRLSSYAEIAGGRTVAQRAVDQIGAPLSADTLVANTKVTFTPESTLFRLTVTNSDPQMAAALATAMADQFAALLTEVDLGDIPSASASPPTDGAPPAEQGEPLATAKATVVDEPVAAGTESRGVMASATLGLALGVVLGVALALVRNATDNTVRTPEALTASSGLPVLAQLPRPSKPKRGHAKLANVVFEEEIRILRNRLMGDATTRTRSVLLAAPAVGQGAATVAVNLALSFTEVDQSVLLVEGDPRQTTIADLLDSESRWGLAEVAFDEQNLYEAVAPTGHDGLWMLASRTPRPGQPQFTTPRLDEILEKMYGHFDRVVIVGPPALVAADAATFAAAIDATVLVACAGRTTIDEFDGALKNLRSIGGKVIGITLTEARVARHTKAATVAYRDNVGDTASLVVRASRK